ncbi:MAG: TolC family protein, partial [Pseudomonadales bacterium]
MFNRAKPASCGHLQHILLLAMCAACAGTAHAASGPLTLDGAVSLAIESDPWLGGSREIESALRDEAVAAASLPDPRIDLRAVNLPLPSLDLSEVPMTQIAVGVSQQFPRGRTRSLARQQKEALAAAEPMRRADRKAKLTATVAGLYLDAWLASASRILIEQDRALFEQLVDAAESQYTTAVGRARQQDLIRAQLELTRLDDRLTVLRQHQDAAQERLSEFVGAAAGSTLPAELPTLEPASTPLVGSADASPEALFAAMRQHPAVLASERQIDSMTTGVALARQKYRPAWGVSAQYGYRADNAQGQSQSDLLSVGITLDVPLFRANRQDREVSAAVAREAAAWSEHDLLVRQLVASLQTARAEFDRLNERRRLYDRRLLPQMSQQAEASLAAYNNADGDFAEAVRARIAEL